MACAFDLKVPDRRRQDMLQLISQSTSSSGSAISTSGASENVVMFRHALLLAGGADADRRANARPCCGSSVEACERYFQAFQFVIWAGKTAREALDCVLFETEGEA